MPELVIKMDGDGAWPDLAEKIRNGTLIEVTSKIEIAPLSNGMGSGAPSVALRLDLPDGKTVFAQTSMKLFLLAAEVYRQKYSGGAWGESPPAVGKDQG